MEPIPGAVKQFLHAHIDSVDQLEILRIVTAEPQKEHGALALAHVLQLPVTAIEANIVTLEGKGLLTIKAKEPLTCQHGPRQEDLAAPLAELMKTYTERPVSLIKLVYEKPKEQIRSFADAFRLRSKKEP